MRAKAAGAAALVLAGAACAGGWTRQPVDRPPAGGAVATLRAVRVDRRAGYDRIAFAFAGALPGARVGYADGPVRECGSGRPVATAGSARLRVHFEVARAHDDAFRATVPADSLAPRLPAVRDLVRTCDFEGVVEWVAGVAGPRPFRVAFPGDPPRIVVDVRHP